MQKNLIAECEKEPIHIPGAVQPFGVLLTVRRPDFIIENVSENCVRSWHVLASDVLGHSFEQYLNLEYIHSFRQYLNAPDLKEQSPLTIKLALGHDIAIEWQLHAHEHHAVLFLEIEPVPTNGIAEPSFSSLRSMRDAILALQRASSLQALCDTAANEIKALTGFDRVMIYRFDREWNGEVVAEAREPNVDSYLGHHFPASDIPAQARAIFLQNWLRMIPDVNYVPAAIHPGLDPVSKRPLDLGRALLRSVSPIHLEYLNNMGVEASLTVSLIDEGKLWGLIACHHSKPLLADSETRIGAQLIGQVMSSQLRIKTALDEREYQSSLNQVSQRLLADMRKHEDYTQALAEGSPSILDIATAHGAAIKRGSEWLLRGTTPSIAEIEELVTWLGESTPEAPLFYTDKLPHEFAQAEKYKEFASGLLAITIARAERNYILLFRPEVVSTITWAGEPAKAVKQAGDQIQLHPRASFHSWTEVVKGKSLPWQSVELDAAEKLRTDVLSVVLQEEFKKERAARQKAERLSREKEEMVLMVSHDLRTPLNVASLSFDFLHQYESSGNAVMRRMVDRGIQASKAMEDLITSILDIAKVEAGTLNVQLKAESATALIQEAIGFYLPIADENGLRLETSIEKSDCIVYCERGRIRQVLNNLLSNALKFTPHGGQVILSVEENEKEAVFCVSDTGPGIPSPQLERVFDRFWQAEDTKRMGTGLGLAIAKGIVEKHGGRIWAESRLGQGTSFYFTLPAKAG